MYVLFDVLSDYSVEPVDGKSQFGDLAHAKSRAVKDNRGQKIKWVKKQERPGMEKWGTWYGSNKHDELINIISFRESNPMKKKRKGNPQRVTQAWLEKRIGLINSMLKRPEAAYTQTADGLKPNAGHFYLDHAYGGVGLEMMAKGGGAHAISGGHVPKRELNTFLDGFIEAIREIQSSRVSNPGKRKKNCGPKKKRNPISSGDISPYDGIGPHVVIIFGDKGAVKYVGKDSQGRYFVTTKSKAHHFKTLDAASGIARGIELPARFKYAGTHKASLPQSFADGIAKTSRSTRGKALRANPVGPTQKEIDSAGNLFREFTGDYPERMKNVKLPVPKTGLVIGELDGVLYTTVRDGKTEKYQHDFKKGSRPLLASSHDGQSLHVLGGEYEFTERGIEDK